MHTDEHDEGRTAKRDETSSRAKDAAQEEEDMSNPDVLEATVRRLTERRYRELAELEDATPERAARLRNLIKWNGIWVERLDAYIVAEREQRARAARCARSTAREGRAVR